MTMQQNSKVDYILGHLTSSTMGSCPKLLEIRLSSLEQVSNAITNQWLWRKPQIQAREPDINQGKLTGTTAFFLRAKQDLNILHFLIGTQPLANSKIKISCLCFINNVVMNGHTSSKANEAKTKQNKTNPVFTYMRIQKKRRQCWFLNQILINVHIQSFDKLGEAIAAQRLIYFQPLPLISHFKKCEY